MAHIHQRVYRNGKKGQWQAVVRHPSGKRLHKSDPLRRVVVAWAAEEEAKIRRGEWVDPAGGKVTLDEWWDRWSAPRLAGTKELATNSKNESHWRNHIQPTFGHWPLATITSWEVEAWVARMVEASAERRAQRRKEGKPEGTTGAETVAAALRLLDQLLGAAVRFRLLAANPADLVTAPAPPKHVDRFLTQDEADLLCAQFEDPEQWLFVNVLLYAGLRWSEAAGLHVHRVDMLRKRFTVVETVRRDGSEKNRPKSEAGQRQVEIVEHLIEPLSRQLAGRPRDGLVFTRTNRKGETVPLEYRSWLRSWDVRVARAGLADPQPTPHDLRHTFGSWLAEGGMPPTDIAALMGHSTLRATERYLHPAGSRFARMTDILGAGDSSKAVRGIRGSSERS